MSRWERQRRKRLVLEKESLENHFKKDNVRWIEETQKPKVEVKMVSNSNRTYTLRLYIPEDFPNSCPTLVIVEPESILHRNGGLVPENSREFHTLKPHDGYQTICHHHPSDWNTDFKLFQIFMKGRLWLEAYEGHLETGKNLDHYLRMYRQTSDSSESPAPQTWLPHQIARLMKEREGLNQFYPDVIEWTKTTVDVQIKTGNHNVYKLRVYLPPDYPNSYPTLAIVSPSVLKKKNGELIPENSTEFRTREIVEGNLTVCHVYPGDWNDSMNLVQVFKRGELWTKVYETYISKNANNEDFLSCLNRCMQSSEH